MNLPHKFQHISRLSLLFSLALHALGLVSLGHSSLHSSTVNLPSQMVISLHTANTSTVIITPRAAASPMPISTAVPSRDSFALANIAPRVPIPTAVPARDSFAPAKAVEEAVNENRIDNDFSWQPAPSVIHATHTGTEGKQSTQETVARPDYDYNPPPDYPLILREQGISGVVWLRVWVDSEGRPIEIKLTKGSGYRLLDDSALRAVKKWRFIPAKLGQQKLASWVEFPIRFTLAG